MMVSIPKELMMTGLPLAHSVETFALPHSKSSKLGSANALSVLDVFVKIR